MEVEDSAVTEEAAKALLVLRRSLEALGVAQVAEVLDVEPANLRKVVKGKRQMTGELMTKLTQSAIVHGNFEA
ncbi:MAG: hypothetical protein RLO80_07335 [Hyphomonas sp.]